MSLLSRSRITLWTTLGVLFALMAHAIAEDITLTTYYPSPRGVYQQLRTTDETLLATEGGNVGIGTTSPVNQLDVEGAAVIGAAYSGATLAPTDGLLVQGNVGIGTTAPVVPLDVAGGVRIGDSSICNAAHAGTLRTRVGGSELSFCNGTDWIPLVQSASSCAPAGDTYTTSYPSCSCGAATYIWEGTQTCTCQANGQWTCTVSCLPAPPSAPPPPCPPWY